MTHVPPLLQTILPLTRFPVRLPQPVATTCVLDRNVPADWLPFSLRNVSALPFCVTSVPFPLNV
ncbi:hypothetical protein D3C83_314910 [compost metagenome]